MKSLTTKTLQIFWQHARRYPWHVFVIILGVLGHIILQNYLPLLYKKLIDLAASSQAREAAPLISIVKAIFFVSIIRIVIARIFQFTNNYFQPRVMADLSQSCFKYLQKHSYDFFSNSFVGGLVTKVKRYEKSFEQVSDQLCFELGRTILEMLIILTILFTQNKNVAIIVSIWAVIYIAFSYFFALYKLPYDIKRAEADSKVTAQLADSVTNNTNIKTFSAYNLEDKEFIKVSNSHFRIRRKSWDLATVSEIFQSVSMITLELAVMYYAVSLWQQNAITVGTIALIQSYFLRLFDKFWGMGKNIRNLYEAIADANEMTEILEKEHDIKDAPNAAYMKKSAGQINFNNVTFGYKDGRPILNNFNFKILPKEKIALVGPSGGGKTTLIKLLFRFYDIQGGEISVDGQNINSVTQDSLRQNISLVPQEPILFHRSLMENIRYGKPDATDKEVFAAAEKSYAHEFISKLKNGYSTLVGERGIKLSGGERQRVAIARAILKNAPVLVLDEATSSLDSESEMYIQQALKNLMQDKTVIVVAHRLSTIMQMDRIVVVENGRIAEQGKHSELLKAKKGIYQKLWGIQAGSFA
ncbi:MAG: ABC transporter ATP-binding protein [Candidatus Doudnabacteria bacterium]|nr:ABC transporter ATP-binding protein [Candidatus Doudnabacteria bacterium]